MTLLQIPAAKERPFGGLLSAPLESTDEAPLRVPDNVELGSNVSELLQNVSTVSPLFFPEPQMETVSQSGYLTDWWGASLEYFREPTKLLVGAKAYTNRLDLVNMLQRSIVGSRRRRPQDPFVYAIRILAFQDTSDAATVESSASSKRTLPRSLLYNELNESDSAAILEHLARFLSKAKSVEVEWSEPIPREFRRINFSVMD